MQTLYRYCIAPADSYTISTSIRHFSTFLENSRKAFLMMVLQFFPLNSIKLTSPPSPYIYLYTVYILKTSTSPLPIPHPPTLPRLKSLFISSNLRYINSGRVCIRLISSINEKQPTEGIATIYQRSNRVYILLVLQVRIKLIEK